MPRDRRGGNEEAIVGGRGGTGLEAARPLLARAKSEDDKADAGLFPVPDGLMPPYKMHPNAHAISSPVTSLKARPIDFEMT
ncbi:hypothetical protein DHEL01_v204640 [Diaporthe helianthi]|uniref:Uncharacterized protein n=1 Tax=Diaporthe helianthi TaxID=158607 RepID=A0A2P5I373_DIAHE|nr:hypothetical protein DHEL01_v204640 [Diaporthe helianthi]